MSGNRRSEVGKRAKYPRGVFGRRSHEYVDVARGSGEAVSREGLRAHDQEIDTVVDETLGDVDEVLVDVHRLQRSRRVNLPGMFLRS
jgi:hypothetical protein